jgi:hypothetical protein
MRWPAAAFTTDGGGVTALDCGSPNGQQWQHNGWRDGGAITMGDETAVARDNCHQCRIGAMGVWYLRCVFFSAKIAATW